MQTTGTQSEYTRIRYERPEASIARVVLARPEKANAQDRAMLYELDAAFGLAMTDPEVRVVIVRVSRKFMSGCAGVGGTCRSRQLPRYRAR